MFFSSENRLTKQMCVEFNKKYGRDWHCFIIREKEFDDDDFDWYVEEARDNYIDFTVDGHRICLFKTINSWKIAGELKSIWVGIEQLNQSINILLFNAYLFWLLLFLQLVEINNKNPLYGLISNFGWVRSVLHFLTSGLLENANKNFKIKNRSKT